MQTESEIREQLAHFQGELRHAEQEASRATRRVNHLRQVVDGLTGLLQADEPDPSARLFEVGTAHTIRSILEKAGGAMTEAVAGDEATVHSVTTVENGVVNAPRGREAVRAILEESRREWSIPDLTAEIQRRGWMKGVERPRDATASSVQRLVTDGVAERVGRGVYRLRLDQLPPPPEVGDG
jgi:hypothetical protein